MQVNSARSSSHMDVVNAENAGAVFCQQGLAFKHRFPINLSGTN